MTETKKTKKAPKKNKKTVAPAAEVKVESTEAAVDSFLEDNSELMDVLAKQEDQEKAVEVEVKKAAPTKVEKKAEPKVEAPKEKLISIKDACRRFIPVFKEYNYPSIKQYANSISQRDPGTEEEMKKLLTGWGVKGL